MKTFKEILLTEKFKNLFDQKDKEQYKDEVYDLLQKSYKKIGGLKGSGFKNPNDMVKNIPFWKLAFIKGVLVAVVMYKKTDFGRKLVALGAIKSENGYTKVREILQQEFKRSYMEVSHGLLGFILKQYPSLVNKYKIKTDDVARIIKKDIQKIDDYTYSRKISGENIEKRLFGTLNK